MRRGARGLDLAAQASAYLELLAGFVDFASLTFVDIEGNVNSYDVLVSENGSIVLTDSLESLVAVVTAADGKVQVSHTADIEYEGNRAFGTAVPEHAGLPQEALDGIANAAANAAEAQERAAEAQDEAAQQVDGQAGNASRDAGEADDERDSEASARAEEARSKAR